ncbi:hypothetical protein ABIC09_003304 [Bradyrhizobium sp. S3.12.5]|uniref:hypothetical protein n=1 Tax=Bradyrhizobium sp. S3.12.5 TaxID=3156386 RepID=UPI003390FB78
MDVSGTISPENMEPAHFVHFYTEFPERMPGSGLNESVGNLYIGRIIVLGKTYLTKQASLLVKFAKTTSDSELSAKLMSKAADLKSQADPMPGGDHSLRAPDVDPDHGTGTA